MSTPERPWDWRLGDTSALRPGPRNSIADVPGIGVGHATRAGDGWLTGVTVVAAPGGARAAADVRGGASATREIAAIDPAGVVERIHAVTLSGGSAYGLEAAGGVLAVLRERGLGFRVGAEPEAVVPVVPGASLFDLGRGGVFTNVPDAALGREAAERALIVDGTVAVGNVGAGTGAVAGEMRGGVGTSSVVLPGGAVIGALVVLNADGATVDLRTGVPWGAFAELGLDDGEGEFAWRRPTEEEGARARRRLSDAAAARPTLRPLNTTLAVIATDAALGRAELQRLASASQAGMARAIRPVHTLADGDVVFALSAGEHVLPAPGPGLLPEHERADALNQIFTAGADALSRAIVHAVLSAASITTPAGYVPGYRDLYGQ